MRSSWRGTYVRSFKLYFRAISILIFKFIVFFGRDSFSHISGRFFSYLTSFILVSYFHSSVFMHFILRATLVIHIQIIIIKFHSSHFVYLYFNPGPLFFFFFKLHCVGDTSTVLQLKKFLRARHSHCIGIYN